MVGVCVLRTLLFQNVCSHARQLHQKLEGFTENWKASSEKWNTFFEEAAGCLHVDMSENVSGALLRFSRVSLITLPELSLVKLHSWQRHGGAVEVAYEVGTGGLRE